MEVQSNFNFDDFDFDFLAPPSSKQDAVNSSISIDETCVGQPQKTKCKICSSNKNKRSRLAERICNTDLVVRQQADLQQSANEIKVLYEIEKQQRIKIEIKSSSWHKENEVLRSELEEWKLKCDQLEARLKENNPPVDVKELVNGFVRVSQKMSDQCSFNALHKRDLVNLNKLKKFCTDHRISPFKRTLGVQNVSKSVECLLWTTNPELVSKPDTCTRATQCVRARTQEQGTQHKTFTLSCGTMTTSVPPLGQIDAASNLPEPNQLLTFHEILGNTIKEWDINPISPIIDPLEPPTREIEPISPINDPPETFTSEMNPISPTDTLTRDIEQISPISDPPKALAIKIYPNSPISAPSESHTQELVKETKTVGTCTILCNVLTNIDEVLQLPKIKACDSRPPSRSMFSSVKDEMSNLNLPYGGLKDYFNEKLLSSKSFGESSSIPNFTPDLFEELWQLFGQMVLGLLQRRSTHPNIRKEEFNNWLPKMYEACQNFEHEILLQKLPIGVPCSSSSSSSKVSMDGCHTNQKDYASQHTASPPKTKSIGTSPIKPSEFKNFVISGEKENNSHNEKTSDNIGIRRIRLFSDSSMFRPIDSQENPIPIKLSNASLIDANSSIVDSSNETAVNFLSSLSTFKNACDNSLEDLDESELELLASTNYPLFNSYSQFHLESASMETNEVTESTASSCCEIEMEMDKSLESLYVNNETNTSIKDKSSESMNMITESDNSIAEICSKEAKAEYVLTDPSPVKLIERDSYEEDDTFGNLIIDDTINPSDSSNDNGNMDCSVKSEILEQQQNEVKYDSTLQLCNSDLSAESLNDIPKSKPIEKRTRKRKQKTDASENVVNPCKRSARLAEKRLLEENKSMFDTPVIIGKYTTSKCKQGLAKNIHDFARNSNCDKPKLLSSSTITGPALSDRTYAPNVPDFISQASDNSPFSKNSHPKTTRTLSTTSSNTTYAENANQYNNLSDPELNDNSKYKDSNICAATVNYFDSPSSPQPLQYNDEEQFKNDSLPIQIPLELRKSAAPMRSCSLLKKLIQKERQSVATANTKVEGKLIREMHTKITEYLQSSKPYEVRNLCYDLQKISKKVDLYISALLNSANVKVIGNSQEQSLNTRFMKAVHHLQKIYPEFLIQFLSKLDNKLFSLNHGMRTTLSESLNLLKIYLATIQLQASTSTSPEYKNPARIIIAKILYFNENYMERLVYEVLCQFPTVLPHRDVKTYDNSDPLITVIKHILMNYKYKMFDKELCGRELLSKLRYEYHFEVYKPLEKDVLDQLISKLESGQLQYLQLSFAVFCKRMNMQKCREDVVNGRLLPLVNTYYDLAKLSSEYDERIAALFTCMSTILKSFELGTDVSACISVFKRFLYSIKRPCVQEAAVKAIIRLQRYGFNLCTEALKDYQPNYTLQPLTVAMLRSFAQRKVSFFKKKPFRSA